MTAGTAGAAGATSSASVAYRDPHPPSANITVKQAVTRRARDLLAA
jgi:hypothetical protein